MKSWNVKIASLAQREMDGLADGLRLEALQRIAELEEDPFPPDAEALRGFKDMYRVYVRGTHRIIYKVTRKNEVLITRVRPRGTAYIGME